MVGGFLAVSLTDTIQGLFMIVALVVLPVIAIQHLGGFSSFFSQAAALENGQFMNPFAIALGAAFGPSSILALYWRKTTRAGTISGMICGALTVIIWNRIPLLSNWLYELIPAFLIALLVNASVSYFTRNNSQADEVFDSMGEE